MNSASQIHSIDKQIVELVTENREVAQNLQHIASVVAKQKIIPELEKICNKYSNHDTVIKLDQLELDLGVLTASGFEAEFFESSVLQFEKEIADTVAELVYNSKHALPEKESTPENGQHKAENQIITQTNKQLDILEQFLKTGQIPWHLNQGKEFSVSELFHQLNRACPQELFALLKKLLNNSNILKRFIYQFGDDIKQISFKAICQKTDSAINNKTIEAILCAWKPDGHLPFSQNKYKIIVWHTVFSELVAGKNNPDYFVVNLISVFLKEIVRSGFSVEQALVFLVYFRKGIFIQNNHIKSKLLTNLVSVADTFVFYIVHKLSEEQDIEKNLNAYEKLTKINGQQTSTGYKFKKQINEHIITEIKKLVESSGFASIEKIKTEILSKGKLITNGLFAENTLNVKIHKETLEEGTTQKHTEIAGIEEEKRKSKTKEEDPQYTRKENPEIDERSRRDKEGEVENLKSESTYQEHLNKIPGNEEENGEKQISRTPEDSPQYARKKNLTIVERLHGDRESETYESSPDILNQQHLNKIPDNEQEEEGKQISKTPEDSPKYNRKKNPAIDERLHRDKEGKIDEPKHESTYQEHLSKTPGYEKKNDEKQISKTPEESPQYTRKGNTTSDKKLHVSSAGEKNKLIRENTEGLSNKCTSNEEFPDREQSKFFNTKPINPVSKRYPFGKIETIEQVYIQNAGLALVWPYLPALFKEQGLLTEKQQFKDFESQLFAVAATHYLVYGAYENVAEYELTFNKLLCGLDLETPIPVLDSIPNFIQTTCDEMLTEAVKNWSALKNSTINGLRATFLQREGRLAKANNGWKLYIERQAFDVLLDRLPWSIAIAVLPWNSKMIYVEW